MYNSQFTYFHNVEGLGDWITLLYFVQYQIGKPVHYNQIYNWTSMSCTAYFSDARVLLLTEHVIVFCVYAAHACSFNYKSDYSILSVSKTISSTVCCIPLQAYAHVTYSLCARTLRRATASDGGLETWFRLSKVSVSSRSRGSKVLVSVETTLSRPQDPTKKKMKIETWKKHSVGGRFQYPQWCFFV